MVVGAIVGHITVVVGAIDGIVSRSFDLQWLLFLDPQWLWLLYPQ